MANSSIRLLFVVVVAVLSGCGLADSDAGPSEEAETSTSALQWQLQWESNDESEGILVMRNGGFPARALDPVLVVGDVELREYLYQEGDQLLFLVPESAELSGEVQFGWAQGMNVNELETTGYQLDGESLEFAAIPP